MVLSPSVDFHWTLSIGPDLVIPGGPSFRSQKINILGTNIISQLYSQFLPESSSLSPSPILAFASYLIFSPPSLFLNAYQRLHASSFIHDFIPIRFPSVMSKIKVIKSKNLPETRRPRSGRPTSFQADQQACLDGYLAEFEEQLRIHDPNLKHGPVKEMNNWKHKTIEAIVKDPSFKGETNDEMLRGVS